MGLGGLNVAFGLPFAGCCVASHNVQSYKVIPCTGRVSDVAGSQGIGCPSGQSKDYIRPTPRPFDVESESGCRSGVVSCIRVGDRSQLDYFSGESFSE